MSLGGNRNVADRSRWSTDSGQGVGTSAKGATGTAAWNALADQYFDQVYFKFAPTVGTAAGLHQYDALLEDYSRASVDRNIRALHEFEKRVEAFDGKSLSELEMADRDIVLSNIRGALLTLETIRPWEKNPDTYSSGITSSVYVIMSRYFVRGLLAGSVKV